MILQFLESSCSNYHDYVIWGDWNSVVGWHVQKYLTNGQTLAIPCGRRLEHCQLCVGWVLSSTSVLNVLWWLYCYSYKKMEFISTMILRWCWNNRLWATTLQACRVVFSRSMFPEVVIHFLFPSPSSSPCPLLTVLWEETLLI